MAKQMTPPERMAALFMGEKPDRVPVNPFVEGYAAMLTLPHFKPNLTSNALSSVAKTSRQERRVPMDSYLRLGVNSLRRLHRSTLWLWWTPPRCLGATNKLRSR